MPSSPERLKGAPSASGGPACGRPIQIAHVVLKTARYSESVDWYCRLFQAEIALANPRITFLSYDDEHHRIAIINGGESLKPKLEDAAGVDHFAFSYETLSELLAVYGRLKSQGILPARSINHGMTISFYYRDPDGNRVELQVDNFGKAEAAAYMHSAEFNANPIGTEFDPDELKRRFATGERLTDLLWPTQQTNPST